MKRERIRKYYEPRLRPGRPHHEILDWASAATQRLRFLVLSAEVELAGRALLDVGCGLGDLLTFLEEQRLAADYTGVDILPAMVEAARQRHPAGRFVCLDVFAGQDPPEKAYDVVFCSGTFNLNLGNNYEFLPGAFARLFRLSRRQVVVNMLHARLPQQMERYFHYDLASVLALLRPMGWAIRVREDYLPNDFTLVCTKPGGADGFGV